MSEQTKLEDIRNYLPAPGTPIRLAFRWNDVESKYIFLQMTEQGIIVTPSSENTKETAPTRRIYFYPWRALDCIDWFADEEVKKDD